MAINPSISFQQKAINYNTSFIRTLLLVGQSNTATAGLYEDIQLKTEKEIETIFGAGQHLTDMIKNTIRENSGLDRFKILVASYQDVNTDTAQVNKFTVSGSSTASGTIKIECFNLDSIISQIASAKCLRETKNAPCSSNIRNNSIAFGSPKYANIPFYPILQKYELAKTIIEVQIASGLTNQQIATAINTAINSNANFLFNSTVATNEVSLTAKNKGKIGTNYHLKILKDTLPSGVTIETSETTAGVGVPDASGILSLVNLAGNTLGNMSFDYVVIPVDYSQTNLITDSYNKKENVVNYGNRCLDYQIFTGDAIDMSSDTALNNLATALPIGTTGIVRSIFIMRLVSVGNIIPIVDKSLITKIENKQFTAIQLEQDNSITIGNTYTLSNDATWKKIEKVSAANVIRKFLIEKAIPRDFTEKNYTTGISINSYTLDKQDIIAIFLFYYNVLSGQTINDEQFGDDYAELISNNPETKAQFEDTLERSISFDKNSDTLAVNLITELLSKIANMTIFMEYK